MLFPRSDLADIKEHEAALYVAAKREGEMTWYIAHYTSETAERVGRTFTENIPGVRSMWCASPRRWRSRAEPGPAVPGRQLRPLRSTDLGHYVT